MLSEATLVRRLDNNPNGVLVSLVIAGMASFWIILRFRGSLDSNPMIASALHRRLLILSSPLAASGLYWAVQTLDFPMSLAAFLIFTLFLGGLVSSFMYTIFRDIPDDQWRSSVSQFKAYTVLFQTLFLVLFKSIEAPEPYMLLLLIAPVSLVAASLVSGAPISWVTLRTLDNLIDASYGLVKTPPRGSELIMIAMGIGGLALAKLTILKTSMQPVAELLVPYSLGYIAGSFAASLRPSIYLAQALAVITLAASSLVSSADTGIQLVLIGAALGYSEIATILSVLEARPRSVRRAMTLITIWVAAAAFIGGLAVYMLGRPVPVVGLVLVGLGILFRIVSASRERGARWSREY